MKLNSGGEKGFHPKYREVDRKQVRLRVMDLESMVGADHPVRAIWELTGGLDLSRFEERILSEEDGSGRPCWPPRVLVSVWVYGYSIGVGSARALSRLMEHEPGLQWLTGEQEVNHHTLSDFRVGHGEALKNLFAQVLAAMDEEGLLDLRTLVQDGTKMRAVAGKQSMHREGRLRQRMGEALQAVGELDRRRKGAQQRAARERLERMQAAMKELSARQQVAAPVERPKIRVSESEPEARKMKHSDGGWVPSYNLQVSTEPKSRVIVSVEVTTDANDTHQMEPAVERFFAYTGRWPEQAIADNGYATRSNVEATSARQINLIAPWKTEASRQAGANKTQGREASFSSEHFEGDGKGG